MSSLEANLFDQPGDYLAFEKILRQAHEQTGIRIAALLSDAQPRHLVLWPRDDGELSEVMRWITVTYTQRWHSSVNLGERPRISGAFQILSLKSDEDFVTVARYVERNALRAKLVKRAEQWQWPSLWRWAQADPEPLAFLCDWRG